MVSNNEKENRNIFDDLFVGAYMPNTYWIYSYNIKKLRPTTLKLTNPKYTKEIVLHRYNIYVHIVICRILLPGGYFNQLSQF